MTIDDDGEIIDNERKGYRDADVVSAFRQAGSPSTLLWLVDFGERMPMARAEIEKKLEGQLRFALLVSTRSEVELDSVDDGYWVSVAVFGVPERFVDTLKEGIDIQSHPYVFLQTQMIYSSPTRLDPYLGSWTKGTLVAVGAAIRRESGIAENAWEIEIELPDGRTFIGYTRDSSLASRPLGTSLDFSLSLVKCVRAKRTSGITSIDLKQRNTYTYEIHGILVGLWWRDSEWYSLEVDSLVVVIRNSSGVLNSIERSSLGHTVDLQGQLEISQLSPF